MCGMGLGWWKPSTARQAMLASLRGRASGHVCRVNRPNTRLLLTIYNYFKKRLANRELSTQDKLPFLNWIVIEVATSKITTAVNSPHWPISQATPKQQMD